MEKGQSKSSFAKASEDKEGQGRTREEKEAGISSVVYSTDKLTN
jgi:hypothetical protein